MAMGEIVFTSRQQVIEFLKSRNWDDGDIKWKCPECGTTNIGAYYSHGSPCGGCDKFVFPRLNLKEILKDGVEAGEIAKMIKEYSGRIARQKEVIDDLRSEIADEENTLDDLREDLRSLKSCNMKKVKVDW